MNNDDGSPRMVMWVALSLLVMAASLLVQDAWPGSLAAVTLYKAHLLSLGGWAGYWLDRGLFPYDRPHEYLEDEAPLGAEPHALDFGAAELQVAGTAFGMSMLRRAIIVAACLVGVCLGA